MRLTVTVQQTDPASDQYLAVTAQANGREICRHTFTFDPDRLVDLEPQWLLEKATPRHAYDPARGETTAAGQQQKKIAELEAYGRRLYAYLFGDGQRLANFLEFNADPRAPLSLTLAMHPNAAPLWRLPWEYLHDGREFWGLTGRFHLNRQPAGLGDLTPEPVPLPLRLLVVVSAPDDQHELDTEEEIGVLQEALDEALRQGRVQVEYVDDALLDNIGAQIRAFNPHVIHYTGHGAYDPQGERSYLALEDELGQTRKAGIAELQPHLTAAHDLRLVVLSGCQTGQTSDQDAFRGVAAGLLKLDIPAVVAMQFAILDNSAIKLAGAFYSALARGETAAAALQAARVALWQYADGPGYDWGIPALYQRAAELRLIDPADLTGLEDLSSFSAPAALIDMDGLPLPRHFVGRKPQLRQLRRALRDDRLKAAFVRGMGGLGKSSLAARLIARPGTPLDGVLVIRCHEVDPLDIPLKLASFLQGQGQPGHAEAGALLLDSRLDPAERARQAARLIAGRRYLIVFDNFESLQEIHRQEGEEREEDEAGTSPSWLDSEYDIADPVLRGLLGGLLTANWRSLCLFTGRYRWRGFDRQIGQNLAQEIHLPQLTLRQAVMLMDNLPRLKRQPIQRKIALFHKVGGHPKTLELLEGWLAQGRLTDLLDNAALDSLLTPEWEGYFLADLLARLSPAERERLARLAIFQDELAGEALAYAGVTDEMAARWLDLSLLQQVNLTGLGDLSGFGKLLVHPVVADYLLGQTDAASRRELHRWAAAYYGRPFVEIARNHAQQTGQNWSEAQIEWFARDRRGVVGHMVTQAQDMAQARGALAWQRHLFAAGEVGAAGEIVTVVFEVLARWGQRDQAKALLRRSIASLATDSGNQAVAQANLATLLTEEGKLDEALATYQESYDTFSAMHSGGQEARQQMAAQLGNMSIVYQMKGDLATAVTRQEESLRLSEEIGNEEGQAISLHQLAMLYRMQEDCPTALARSQAAEKLARKVGNEALTATTLHEQGLIYNEMARDDGGRRARHFTSFSASSEPAEGTKDEGVESDEQRVTTPPNYRSLAAQRFQKSLAIQQRIGDEGGTASTLNELGKLLLDAGQMRAATVAFREALEIFRRQGNPARAAISIEALGVIHEDQGEYAAALAKYQEALALAQQYSSPQHIAIVENHIARVRAKMPAA
jgi:tetratricopeptide (TPR) repeat protein